MTTDPLDDHELLDLDELDEHAFDTDFDRELHRRGLVDGADLDDDLDDPERW